MPAVNGAARRAPGLHAGGDSEAEPWGIGRRAKDAGPATVPELAPGPGSQPLLTLVMQNRASRKVPKVTPNVKSFRCRFRTWKSSARPVMTASMPPIWRGPGRNEGRPRLGLGPARLTHPGGCPLLSRETAPCFCPVLKQTQKPGGAGGAKVALCPLLIRRRSSLGPLARQG